MAFSVIAAAISLSIPTTRPAPGQSLLPHAGPVPDPDQFHRYADVLLIGSQVPFYQVVSVQFASDLRHRFGSMPVCHRRPVRTTASRAGSVFPDCVINSCVMPSHTEHGRHRRSGLPAANSQNHLLIGGIARRASSQHNQQPDQKQHRAQQRDRDRFSPQPPRCSPRGHLSPNGTALAAKLPPDPATGIHASEWSLYTPENSPTVA